MILSFIQFPRHLLLLALSLGASQNMTAAEIGPEIDFNLPAGKSSVTLKSFYEQSGQQLIFLADEVQGVETNAVIGRHSARAAVELMLNGTPLVVREEAQTGALTVRRSASGDDGLVELPPFVVEEKPGKATVPWRYVALPGIEVLSRCSDEATIGLIEHNYRLQRLLDLILPPELRVKLDVPTKYVLYNERTQNQMAREITGKIQEQELENMSKAQRSRAKWKVRVMPNYRFWDQDSLAIFFVLEEVDYTTSRLSLTPSYIRYLLENRAPSLPLWYVDGMQELYASVFLATPKLMLSAALDDPMFEGATHTSMRSPTGAMPGAGGGFGNLALQAAGYKKGGTLNTKNREFPEGLVVINPLQWVSEAETQKVRKAGRGKYELPAVASLLADARPATADDSKTKRRKSHASLFIRWALDDLKRERRAALWQFVTRASVAPATEAMFRECFGQGYAETDQQLRDYLPDAVKNGFVLQPEGLANLPEVRLHNASESEIGRVKGDFNRMEIAYVKELYPELTAKYVTQARDTLRRAYDDGADNDPRLLALLGLCECDAGDDAAAKPYLEAATSGGVVRPRAYYELARINYQAALQENPEGKLSPAVAGEILKPLVLALRQSPPMPEIYELIAEVWLRTEGGLTRKHLAVLEAGIRNFPRRSRLIFSAALLNATNGFGLEAQALVHQGQAIAISPKERERFQKLQTVLSKAQ
ncbi:MAG: STN domain-containing protein [Opitutaceae bacterium]|nr:STN domain-containing protein [Opitutaceae bacterium]